MELFIMGAIAMASVVAAVFFLRFWRDTRDRLFLAFATAFLVLGISRLGLVLSRENLEGESQWYWARLAAFLLILLAVIDKNRR